MSKRLGFPSPDQVAAQTPADRDRAVDVIRIAALLGVVLGHTVMATSTLRDGVFVWDNLLTTSVLFQALTWVLQIMPLFFFAGAAVAGWRAGASWGGWLMTRCLRLYRPVFYYLAFWTVTLAVLHRVLPVHTYEPVAGISIQLLWFLGAYVLMLAAMPMHSAPLAWPCRPWRPTRSRPGSARPSSTPGSPPGPGSAVFSSRPARATAAGSGSSSRSSRSGRPFDATKPTRLLSNPWPKSTHRLAWSRRSWLLPPRQGRRSRRVVGR